MVVSSWLEIIFNELELGFTGFRALRLVRPLMLIQLFSGLKAIFISLAHNSDRIINVIIMMTFFLTLFGVAGQQLFQGVFRARCLVGETNAVSYPEIFCHSTACPYNMTCSEDFGDPVNGNVGYDNIGQAMLNLFIFSTFELVSMDFAQQAWTPAIIATFFYLVVLVVVALVINNLFVAVICFGYSRASEDIATELAERTAAEMAAMDADGDNMVSLDEFTAGGGTKEDFDIADIDGDGVLDENELAQRELARHQQQMYEEQHPLSVANMVPETSISKDEAFGTAALVEVKQRGSQEEDHACIKIATALYEMQHFSTVVTIAILINTVFMAMVYYGMSDSYENMLAITEICFTIFFLLEMVVKLGALGVTEYVKDSWNLMDGGIVIMGMADTVVQIGLNVSFIRLFRLLRIIKALRGLRENKDVGTLLKASLGSGVPMMNNMLFLVLLLTMFGNISQILSTDSVLIDSVLVRTGLLGMPLFGN